MKVFFIRLLILESVSYTHLDVYKRQELYSGSSLPGFDPSIWNFREGEYPDLFFEFEDLIEMPAAVSYTHLS